MIKWCFVLVTLPFALLPFSLILAAIWVLGSAILDPNQFLARTAAFAALVTTLTSIGNQLRGAAAAKEMVYLAEQGFFNKGQPFDPAWQEMLNHATMKVRKANRN